MAIIHLADRYFPLDDAIAKSLEIGIDLPYGHVLHLEMTHLLPVINSTSPEVDLTVDTAQFLTVTLVFELFLSDPHNFLLFGCAQILFLSFL